MQNVMSSDTFERATVLPPLAATEPPQAAEASMLNRLSLLVDLASLLTREVDFDALLATACERVPSVDKATGYTTRTILAVPIRDGGESGGRGPVRGVVQV